MEAAEQGDAVRYDPLAGASLILRVTRRMETSGLGVLFPGDLLAFVNRDPEAGDLVAVESGKQSTLALLWVREAHGRRRLCDQQGRAVPGVRLRDVRGVCVGMVRRHYRAGG